MLNYEKRDDGVGLIQMDDGKANAITPALIGELMETLNRAQAECEAVVLAGREGRFSAGFDLKLMMASAESAISLLKTGVDLYLRLYSFPKPLVLACTGHAVAGGAVMLCTGDYRIGTEGEFKIGLNEVALGMPLPIFAMDLARERLDPRFVTEATLLAQIYAPIQALAVGYLDQVVDHDQVLDVSIAKAAELGAMDSGAFNATKKRLRDKTAEHIRATLADDLKDFVPPAPTK